MHILKRERGIVLLITLVVLIIMTLGALSIARSLDATTLVAGNLAFRQSAAYSGDVGTETAITWLDTSGATTLLNDSPADGYWAAALSVAPAAGVTWDTFWTNSLEARSKTLPVDSIGNTVKYVVDRMCSSVGASTDCVFLPSTTTTPGGKEEGSPPLKGIPQVIYRITARIEGPRNTISYVQTNVAK